MTFGFGAGLFVKDGVDRYGLAARRPPALIDLPQVRWRRIGPDATGGDLSVQACANDPQVAFHAVRQFARRADGMAQVRRVQSGFVARPATGDTAQFDGLQGRNRQSLVRSQGDGPIVLGRPRGGGLDARRQLCRRAPHPMALEHGIA